MSKHDHPARTAAEPSSSSSSPAPPSLDFDPEDLTLAEVGELEELLGGGFDSMLSGDTPKAAALQAIMWILMRRSNPEATLEDAGKLRLRDIGVELVDAGQGDQAAGELDTASPGND